MLKHLWLILFVTIYSGGEKFLNEIPLYQQESYFKQKVYAEHDYKSFYTLKEPNQIVNPDKYDLHLLNAAVFFATNKLREEKKLKPLKFSAELRNAAVVHTQQMIEKKFFNHINNRAPKLRNPDDRIKLYGVETNAAGENIDLNNISMPSSTTYLQVAEKIVDDFYHSPEHRKTMLSKSYSYLGCAAMFEEKDKDGVRYFKATQDFSADYK